MRSRRPESAASSEAVRNFLDVYRRLASLSVAEVCCRIGEEYLRQFLRPYRSGPDPSIPTKTWYAWVAGHRPDPTLIGPITRVLTATTGQLWRYPGEYQAPPAAEWTATGGDTASAPYDRAHPRTPEEEAMDRRHALIALGIGIGSAAAAATTTPAVAAPLRLDRELAWQLAAQPPRSPAGRGVDLTEVARLDDEVSLLVRGGWTVPAAELLPLARERLTAIRAWSGNAAGSQQQRELDRRVGRAALGVAWLAYNAHRLGESQRAFVLSEQTALAAGDQPLAACAATRSSRLWLHGPGGPRQALAPLARARRYLPGGRSIVAARTADFATSVHIRMGNKPEALANLRIIEQVLGHATDRGQRRGLYGYGDRQFHAAQAEIENAFGDPRLALGHAAQAIAMSPPGELSDRHLFVLEQAKAHRLLGDVEAAVIVAEPILSEVPPSAWAGLLGARLDRFVSADLAGASGRHAQAFCSRYLELRQRHTTA